MRLNTSTGLVDFSESALLHSPHINAVGKNWTPFQFDLRNTDHNSNSYIHNNGNDNETAAENSINANPDNQSSSGGGSSSIL